MFPAVIAFPEFLNEFANEILKEMRPRSVSSTTGLNAEHGNTIWNLPADRCPRRNKTAPKLTMSAKGPRVA